MKYIKDTPFDIVINVLSILLCAAATILLIIKMGDLPAEIVFQYTAEGEPEVSKAKVYLWVIPGIMWLLFLAFFATTKWSKKSKAFRVHITEENRERVLRATKDMGAIAKLLLLAFFFVLLTYLMQNVMIPNMISVSFIILIVADVLLGAYRAKKEE